MTRVQIRKHLLTAFGVLALATLLGLHLGVNGGQWWLLISVAVILHASAFGVLAAWIVRRIRGARAAE